MYPTNLLSMDKAATTYKDTYSFGFNFYCVIEGQMTSDLWPGFFLSFFTVSLYNSYQSSTYIHIYIFNSILLQVQPDWLNAIGQNWDFISFPKALSFHPSTTGTKRLLTQTSSTQNCYRNFCHLLPSAGGFFFYLCPPPTFHNLLVKRP